MRENILENKSNLFAVNIINLCKRMKKRGEMHELVSQILRSGTSIGANVHEANYAASKADFINKLQIALKECHETEYWLDIFQQTKLITDDEFTFLNEKCGDLKRILVKSLRTAKSNRLKQKLEKRLKKKKSAEN